jgi:hypothetical protein|uniref:Uncharacterized protein n=1 Tax=virus sp. ctmTa7 TaxID=2828255 RepID=A0A8S5RCD5_9VIRU|nr:MAG TPA: hypothetical protein [virus sp. ctmTa7]
MISTVDTTLSVINGYACIVPVQYPNWYDIPEIGFINHGEWSDPYIEYKGKQINSHIIEDAMYEEYCEECEPGKDNLDDFAIYMKNHTEYVYNLIDEINVCI